MIARIAGIVLAAALVVSSRWAFAQSAETAVHVVPAARIATLAEHAARSLVSDPARALVPAFTLSDQSVPAGTLAVTTGTPQVSTTFVSVPVALTVDGRVVRTVFAGYRVTSYVRMAVAAHDLTPGTILTADDLTYAQVAFTGRPSFDIDSFIGRKVRATVARGEAVFPELTVVNEIVHAGMPAILIVHDGPVLLAADVVARNSGGLGDSVTIFDPQTQRVLSGVVTGPNTVELTLPGAN